MYLAVDRQPHTRQKSLFSCSFLSRISRKSSLLSFPIISKHSPDIKSELPGVQDPEGHSIKSDHSQTGGGGGPFLLKASQSLMDVTAPAKVLPSGPGASRPSLPHVLGDSLEQLTRVKSLLCWGLCGVLTHSAHRGLSRAVGGTFS